MSSYAVTARKWERGWELEIHGTNHPEVAATQSHGLYDAERMVRSWLSITDHPDADTATLIWSYSLGDEWIESELASARQAVADAAEAQVVAADRSRKVVRLLLDRGIKSAEVATMMGLSKQRISQLIHT